MVAGIRRGSVWWRWLVTGIVGVGGTSMMVMPVAAADDLFDLVVSPSNAIVTNGDMEVRGAYGCNDGDNMTITVVVHQGLLKVATSSFSLMCPASWWAWGVDVSPMLGQTWDLSTAEVTVTAVDVLATGRVETMPAVNVGAPYASGLAPAYLTTHQSNF